MPTVRDTPAAGRILDVAEQLAQTRGLNGFSYADIAAELNVTKASLHCHFPSKADLGRTLITRYRAAFGHGQFWALTPCMASNAMAAKQVRIVTRFMIQSLLEMIKREAGVKAARLLLELLTASIQSR